MRSRQIRSVSRRPSRKAHMGRNILKILTALFVFSASAVCVEKPFHTMLTLQHTQHLPRRRYSELSLLLQQTWIQRVWGTRFWCLIRPLSCTPKTSSTVLCRYWYKSWKIRRCLFSTMTKYCLQIYWILVSKLHYGRKWFLSFRKWEFRRSMGLTDLTTVPRRWEIYDALRPSFFQSSPWKLRSLLDIRWSNSYALVRLTF